MRFGAAKVILLVVGIGVSGVVGCKKSKETAVQDPHSPQGIVQRMQDHGQRLHDALARKDFGYIHDYAYYFNGLTKALNSTLDADGKEKFRSSLEELNNLANELDHSAGRRHAEATEASIQRLQAIVKDLDKQIRETRRG